MFYVGILVLLAVADLVVFWIWTRSLAAKAEKTAPRLGRVIAVEGGSIHYTDVGPRGGKAVVLIHGLAGNMRNFNYGMVEDLSRVFRVITIDRPGSGYSMRQSDDLASMPEQSAMIWAFLDKLGVEKPVLVGHSLGGALSLAMAMDRKGATGALALLAPLTAVIPEPPPVFRQLRIGSPTIRRIIGHTIAAPVARMTSKKVFREVFAPETPPEDFISRGGGILGMRPKAFVTASADLNGVHGSLAAQCARYPSDLDSPGGILFGTDDNLLAPEIHGEPMQAFGLVFETLPGRGHMIPVTAPEACSDFVRRMAQLSA
ncbi:MAG: alpha/beta hydrolase [Hoeflea sp.]|uniref:alpha/beta fold hydrolase n=1 Tax=Hoeflea sp. TaxID=1940281 RepID=UPI0032EFFC4B